MFLPLFYPIMKKIPKRKSSLVHQRTLISLPYIENTSFLFGKEIRQSLNLKELRYSKIDELDDLIYELINVR